MGLQKIDAFKCSDCRVFTSEEEATNWQNDLCYEAIDKAMRNYSEFSPEVHYPALKATLIPYMKENAKEIIQALGLVL